MNSESTASCKEIILPKGYIRSVDNDATKIVNIRDNRQPCANFKTIGPNSTTIAQDEICATFSPNATYIPLENIPYFQLMQMLNTEISKGIKQVEEKINLKLKNIEADSKTQKENLADIKAENNNGLKSLESKLDSNKNESNKNINDVRSDYSNDRRHLIQLLITMILGMLGLVYFMVTQFNNLKDDNYKIKDRVTIIENHSEIIKSKNGQIEKLINK